MAPGDDARERRDHVRVAQRVLRELQLRLGGLERAARDVVGRLGAVECVLRDELVVQQPHVHRARLLGERDLRPRAFHRTHAVDELRLQVGRFDVRDLLPGAHRLAFTDGQARDVPGDLGLHHGLAHRLQRARYRQPAREHVVFDVGQVGGCELQCNDRLRGVLAVRRGALRRPERDGPREPADQRQHNQPGHHTPARHA